jgi:sirohydrochlorin ferrochelatase
MAELPTLLVAAHGTRSAAGSVTTASLVADVAAARPELRVALCFLDVARPSLADALAEHREPTIVVPLLLSSGYHVLEDIPAVVSHRTNVRVARHLGPDPLVIDVLVDRLATARGTTAVRSSILVGAGSSHPTAAAELALAAQQLATRLGRPVPVLTLAEDVRTALTAAPAPVEVATYLLADGQFAEALRTAAADTPVAIVSAPIGVHPALVALVLARYDEVSAG